MRLRKHYREVISQIAREVFGTKTEVFLFGSRVDDRQKGGDIDLYVVPEKRDNLFDKKIKFLVKLKMTLGEQKIDVVVAKDPNRMIEKEARAKGIKL
jgi:predicted nucleotidyltransferase